MEVENQKHDEKDNRGKTRGMKHDEKDNRGISYSCAGQSIILLLPPKSFI